METKEILRNLIKFDTCKDKENNEIMDYIQALLEEKGFITEYKSKCLVMNINDKSNLGFIGHTDTVSIGENWKYKPLELTQIDNKLYGLGTCDMKGGIAAIIKAVLDTNWNRYKYGIKLLFTYDEEIGFKGIKEINNNKIEVPENVIIGEPTNNEVMNGSKGLIELKFNFFGKSAHSSNPAKGINAIEKCMSFLNEFKVFYEELKNKKDERFKIPYSTMNIGKIEGGVSTSIVPSGCSVYIDFRVICNEDRQKIFEKINELGEKYEYRYTIINDIKPFIADCDKINTTNFITEASFINSRNRLILGAGPINPHEANEYITTESLENLVKQYKEIIDKYCKY